MADRYLLGHAAREHARLAEQHLLWRDGLLATLSRHGLEEGARVMEVGCGGGHLLADLAARAAATGVERDPEAAARARALAGVPVIEGDLRTVELGGTWDLIVARWVFSFLDAPGDAADRLGAALRPGGRLVVQDYDHDGIGFWPPDEVIMRVIEAFREAYRNSGGDLWVAARLPAILTARGWTVHAVEPEVRTGRPGDPTWRWVSRFLHEHSAGLVTTGLLTAAELAEFRVAWSRLEATPGALFVSPLQLTVVASPS